MPPPTLDPPSVVAMCSAAALSRCVPVPQVTALAGALEGRLRTHAAAAQQATQCTGRLATLLWRQVRGLKSAGRNA